METRTAPNTVTVSQEKAIPRLVTEASAHTQFASLSTHPLLSIVAAAYVLGLLYLPRYPLCLLLFPLAVSTLLLLLAALLHFGPSAARLDDPQTRPSELQNHAHSGKEQRQHLWPSPPCVSVPCFPHKPVFRSDNQQFTELTRHGPLEVIYEEYEGEEEDGVDTPPGCCRSPGPGRRRALEGMELLGLRFSDDDSPSECSGASSTSPGWDSPENLCFLWEVEEDGLLEISLEEDNLIEIDLSACR